MFGIQATQPQPKRHDHTILHTRIDRSGNLVVGIGTRMNGTDDHLAVETFDQHVKFAQSAWETGRTWNGKPVRITAVVLVDANDNVLREWTYEPATVEVA